MEIETLEQERSNLSPNSMGAPPPELVDVAQHLFGQFVDPKAETDQMHEILEYAMEHGDVKGPQDLLAYITNLDRQASQAFPRDALMSRVWKAVQMLKIQRAQRNLAF